MLLELALLLAGQLFALFQNLLGNRDHADIGIERANGQLLEFVPVQVEEPAYTDRYDGHVNGMLVQIGVGRLDGGEVEHHIGL